MILFSSRHVIKRKLLSALSGACITEVADWDIVHANGSNYLVVACMGECI